MSAEQVISHNLGQKINKAPTVDEFLHWESEARKSRRVTARRLLEESRGLRDFLKGKSQTTTTSTPVIEHVSNRERPKLKVIVSPEVHRHYKKRVRRRPLIAHKERAPIIFRRDRTFLEKVPESDLTKALERFPRRSREVFEERYGLRAEGEGPKSRKAVAKMCGVGPGTVTLITTEVLIVLRKRFEV